MTPSTAKTVRRSICIALGSAALAAAGAAAAQSYAYPSQTTTTYGPGYESTTTTTYGPPTTTYWPGDETVTSAPYESSSTTTTYSSTAPAYAPAPAYVEPGITVYSHRRLRGEHPEISQGVSYTDLDLTTDAGVAELKWRVDRTARALCAELGEESEISQNTSVLPSCQAAARDSAAIQVHDAVEAARYAPHYYAYGR